MIGAHQPQNRSRAWFLTFLRSAAALAVLGALFHFLPLAPLRSALAGVPAVRFLIVLLVYLAAHAAGIGKWKMVVNAAGSGLDFRTSAQCYLGGLFGTLFLPSIVGGDIVRMAVGLRRSPRPAAVLAGNLADRFLDMAAQATLVAAGLALLPGSLPPEFRSLALRMVLVSVAAGLGLLLAAAGFRRFLFRGRSLRFRRRLARFRGAFRSVRQKPHVLIAGWLTGVLIQATFILLNALLAISCGLFLPLRVWLFAWPLAKLAALLPLTQGGMGVREAVLVALLLPFSAPATLVLASGLAWEGVVIAGGLLSGLAAFLFRRESSPAP